MDVYVPYDPRDPKTRLSPVLSPDEREALNRRLLADVCRCITQAGHDPVVLGTREPTLEVATRLSTAPLSKAVGEALAARDPGPDDPVGIVMADLGLVIAPALTSLFDRDAPVVLAPGRRAGTNAVVTRSPAFEVNYHGASYLDHLGIAAERGIEVATVDSFRLATDIDEPDDLLELAVHGWGQAATYLRARFELRTEGPELVRTSGTPPTNRADASAALDTDG